mmetsp:Transcript_19618/g.25852  ORF Transcript_19618/g.25852 Transcript_19618/m.25852 type:complete len:316 (-) Transcript_19618:404-1351(-)
MKVQSISIALCAGLLGLTSAFVPSAPGSNIQNGALIGSKNKMIMLMKDRADPSKEFNPMNYKLNSASNSKIGFAAAAAAMPLVLGAQEAAAKGGELGAWEGRTFALIHPFTMIGLFLGTFYAGYTGLQWRSVRTTGDDINELKAQLPTLSTGPAVSPVANQIQQIKAELAGMDDSGKRAQLEADIATLEGVKALDDQIVALVQKRKDLVKGDFRDKHWTFSSWLLALGVTISIEGPVNTYIRTGKLFPGPHLYAGAAVTAIWAIAAALTPAMQKGNNAARSAHIALNTINLGLFAWQLQTGLGILEKVFQFTKWP